MVPVHNGWFFVLLFPDSQAAFWYGLRKLRIEIKPLGQMKSNPAHGVNLPICVCLVAQPAAFLDW
jgi:hypothetical protein